MASGEFSLDDFSLLGGRPQGNDGPPPGTPIENNLVTVASSSPLQPVEVEKKVEPIDIASNSAASVHLRTSGTLNFEDTLEELRQKAAGAQKAFADQARIDAGKTEEQIAKVDREIDEIRERLADAEKRRESLRKNGFKSERLLRLHREQQEIDAELSKAEADAAKLAIALAKLNNAQPATPKTTAADPAATPPAASNGTSGKPSLRERARAWLLKKD